VHHAFPFSGALDRATFTSGDDSLPLQASLIGDMIRGTQVPISTITSRSVIGTTIYRRGRILDTTSRDGTERMMTEGRMECWESRFDGSVSWMSCLDLAWRVPRGAARPPILQLAWLLT
jgi:hypothetical protein